MVDKISGKRFPIVHSWCWTFLSSQQLESDKPFRDLEAGKEPEKPVLFRFCGD